MFLNGSSTNPTVQWRWSDWTSARSHGHLKSRSPEERRLGEKTLKVLEHGRSPDVLQMDDTPLSSPQGRVSLLFNVSEAEMSWKQCDCGGTTDEVATSGHKKAHISLTVWPRWSEKKKIGPDQMNELNSLFECGFKEAFYYFNIYELITQDDTLLFGWLPQHLLCGIFKEAPWLKTLVCSSPVGSSSRLPIAVRRHVCVCEFN